MMQLERIAVVSPAHSTYHIGRIHVLSNGVCATQRSQSIDMQLQDQKMMAQYQFVINQVIPHLMHTSFFASLDLLHKNDPPSLFICKMIKFKGCMQIRLMQNF